MLTIVILIFVIFFMFLFWIIIKSRNMHIWIIPYIKQSLKQRNKSKGKKHIYFCLADHYEPFYMKADQLTARSLVLNWVAKYRTIANSHQDSLGNKPRHSYFYPIEEYDEIILNEINSICKEGLGDVDIHLHHDNDTAHNLEKTLNDFKVMLHEKHDLLRKDEHGNIVYGFIHGNWALDNSRPDGRWCGVNNEIDVLLNTGCVFDMTMPSAPSDTQTYTVNSIYFAREDGKAKSHDKGIRAKVGNWMPDLLLMIQGPLALNWKNRKLGFMPKIESGELSYDAPPTQDRLALWEQCGISIEGAENHIFIKVHTHGLQKQNMKMFFELDGLNHLWTMLEMQYRDNENYILNYVTAWEMYLKIKQLSTQGVT